MKQSLNFNWSYKDDYKDEYLTTDLKDYLTINIPHNIADVPYNYFDEKIYQKVVTYEKYFDVDESLIDKTSILVFEGFMLQADIYLNSHFLGHFVSGYLPIKIDVSEFISSKNNRLLVVLDSREDPLIPPFGFAVDYLTFSGIYREVYLEVHDQNYLDDIYVHADMNGGINIDFHRYGNEEKKVNFILFDKDDKKIIESDKPIFKIDHPILWDINNPYLYKLLIKYGKNEKYECKVGFRNAEFRSDGFYLNNKRLHLVGLNRHQLYPYVGAAMPKRLQIEDAKLLKEIGCNVVRCSHYPQSEHFLNTCDEIGLLFVDEIPGWQHISKEEVWRNHYYSFVERMILKERNHPSLIAYGVRIDESIDDHELYLKGNEIAHSLDKYRQTLGVRNSKNSELLEDIYSYNDFVCSSLKQGVLNPNKVKKGNSPYLISEYMGHMDPLKVTSDIEKAQEVSLRHLRVIDDSYKYKRISGCIGWCFVDYYTHVDFGSGDHICTHGVLDMFRNKKYSSYSYESQQDNHPFLKVLTNMKPGDFPEACYKDIYVFTNCDYVNLYKNDQFVKKYVPNHKEYKNIKHPPIKVMDILGETFKIDKFNKKENRRFAEIFSFGGIYGYGKLKFNDKFYVLRKCIKYHMGWNDLLAIWNNEIATWGGYAKAFTFKGYINDQEVASQIIAPYFEFNYEFKYDNLELHNEETYDVLPIRISLKDKYGDLMNYASRSFEIKTSGPIKLIGPKYQSLLGGQITVYIKSLNEKGIGKVSFIFDDYQKDLEIEVK